MGSRSKNNTRQIIKGTLITFRDSKKTRWLTKDTKVEDLPKTAVLKKTRVVIKHKV